MGRKKKEVIEEVFEEVAEDTEEEADDLADDIYSGNATEDDEELPEDDVVTRGRDADPIVEKKATKLFSKKKTKTIEVEDGGCTFTPKIVDDVELPQRTRMGKWTELAKALEVGSAVVNLRDRKEAIGLVNAIKKIGATAKFRKLDTGLYGVWKL